MNKKILSKFRTYCKRKLQRMGYKKGLVRYHWAGDCDRCRSMNDEGKKNCGKCNGTGADREFKPHLNFLIEEGYLTDKQFEEKIALFRADLGNWFNSEFKNELHGTKVVGQCFYSYATNKAHRIHKLKYITRATFRHYNKKVCEIIKGFRTSSQWGKWEKSTHERVSDLISFENGHCPHCLKSDGVIEKIKWQKDFIFRKAFNRMDKIHIEGGYFSINTNTS